MIVVQRIVTMWTKATRSTHRERRARLPTAYPLPDAVLVSRASCTVHQIDRGEQDEYQPRSSVVDHGRPTACIGSASACSVVLEERGDGLHVGFRWTASDCGQPHRHQAGPIVVPTGARAVVRFNGRFIGYEDPWYEDKIVHVAYGVLPQRELFEAPRPRQALICLVDLW
jgi:hypothetical protein